MLHRVVQNLNKELAVFDVRTMTDLYQSRAIATPNIITQLVAGMGAMGLILAVIGLYGVVSYSVSRRFHEFGIRMAVGADRRDVVLMVLRQGAVIGIAVGLIAGVFASIAVKSMALFSFDSGRLQAVPRHLARAVMRDLARRLRSSPPRLAHRSHAGHPRRIVVSHSSRTRFRIVF